MTWNHKELEENIETLFGKEQRELLSPCLETIEEKEFYATYHCDEVERLINEELKGLEPDNHKLLNVREGTEEHKKVLLVIRKARAHIIACLQSLHSLADVVVDRVYSMLKQ